MRDMFQLNVRFIVKMLGLMLMLETLFMLSAVIVAFLYKGNDLYPLLWSSGIMAFVGFILYLLGLKANENTAGRREGMLTVTLTWILFSFFGMLPFCLGGYIPSIAGAYFETMSGYTTTGSTVLADVESLPHGILFWRSLTQWQGGIGMIVFTVALLPIFGVGASQLFDAETTSITHERFRPRVTQVAKRLWGLYVFFTLILVGLLWAGPMNLFDSVCHAFTCISTGGYSTKNNSVAFWNSAYIDYTLALFMFIGATNFTLLYFFMQGNFKKLLKNEEVRWYFFFVLVTIIVVVIWLVTKGIVSDVVYAIRLATFQVITLITTTGFASADYLPWGAFFWMIALLLMVICGCAGSTCGGLKMGRFVVLVKNSMNQFKKQTHPHAVIPVRINGQALSHDIVTRVMAFASIYIVLIVIGSLLLMADGLPFDEALGAAVSGVGNVGPGFGASGPVGNYAHFSDFSLWVLSFIMMTGRLELFTVITLLFPGFWKQ